jgi:hypothetical protein
MQLQRSVRTALITTAIAGVCSTLLIAAPAQAVPLDDRSVISAVDRAEAVLGLRDDQVDDDVTVHGAGEVVEVPVTGGSVRVTTGDARADGSSVRYTVDQLDPRTTRLAAVLSTAGTSETRWDFGPDADLFVLPDGRVSVSDDKGELLAGVDAPWAVDAAGAPVPTSYTVEGSRLVQHLEYSPSTVFPVVADPKFTSFPGYWTATFNRSESATVVGTVAACAALLSKSPVPALRALTVACGALAAFSGAQLAGGKCVKVHVAGAPPMVGTWWPTFPKC